MSQIKVSVIIPVYNTEKYLVKCLVSVLNQSLREIEIICINDCSTDNSDEIINKFQKQDSRIIYKKNNNNKGLSISRNIGIECARGKYIFFLDSDDYIKENTLEELYYKAYEYNLDILYFGFNEIQINGEKVKRKGEDFFPDIIEGKDFFCNSMEKNNSYLMSWTAIYDRNFIKKNNIMFEKEIIFEDDLFYVKALMTATRVSSVNDCYYGYMRRDNSITKSTNNIQKKIWSLCKIIVKTYEYLENDYDDRVNISLDKFIRLESKALINYYKRIDCFDMSDVKKHRADYIMLSIASSSLYNGFFQFKLPLEILEKIRENQKIVIYGAGKVGQGLNELLCERGICISCFAETKLENKLQINGIDTVEIQEADRDSLILIAIKNKSYKLVDNAKSLGFKYIVDINEYI